MITSNDIFLIEHPGGCLEFRISEFFVCPAAESNVKKLFTFAKNHCTETERLELLRALRELEASFADRLKMACQAIAVEEVEYGAFDAKLQRFSLLARERVRLARNIRDLSTRRWKNE